MDRISLGDIKLKQEIYQNRINKKHFNNIKQAAYIQSNKHKMLGKICNKIISFISH